MVNTGNDAASRAATAIADSAPMNRGTIAVVIPTYDHGALLRETVLSVLAQTRPAAAIVIVNDGGPRDPTEFVADLMNRAPIRVVHQANAGTAAARNFGASTLTTDYVLFLDDDDRQVPEALETLASSLDSGRWVAVAGGARVFPPPALGPEVFLPLEVPDGEYFDSLLSSNRFFASAVLMRRTAFERAGGYRANIRGIEDYDLWLRIARQGPIARCGTIVLEYRDHPGSYTRQMTQLDYAPEVARMVASLGAGAGRVAGARVRVHLLEAFLDDLLWGIRGDLRSGKLGRAGTKMLRAIKPLLSPSPSYRVTRSWLRIFLINLRRHPSPSAPTNSMQTPA